MKIEIRSQHLTGNEPEDFNSAAWLSALEQEYRALALAQYPAAEIIVDIDVQRASGCCRNVTVDILNDDGEPVFDSALQTAIEYAADDLYNTRGDEFFE